MKRKGMCREKKSAAGRAARGKKGESEKKYLRLEDKLETHVFLLKLPPGIDPAIFDLLNQRHPIATYTLYYFLIEIYLLLSLRC